MVMKNDGGASFSLQRRLKPAFFSAQNGECAANFGLFFYGAVPNNSSAPRLPYPKRRRSVCEKRRR
jgi:hypothetical protein